MNYKKVIEDFNNGTIDKSIVTLVVDNDGGYWEVNTGDESRDERFSAKMEEKYGVPNGYRDIVDVLNGAGVPAEWC